MYNIVYRAYMIKGQLFIFEVNVLTGKRKRVRGG